MLNVAGVLDRLNRGRKLLQVATCVAAAMVVAPSSAGAAIINCVTTENDGGCDGTPDTYDAEDEFETNTWKFFTGGSDSTLLYELTISGDPSSTFDLQVLDDVVTQEELEETGALVLFPTAVCIPTFDETRCGLFNVFAEGQFPEWEDPGYLLQITWFSNDNDLSHPPEDGNNTILKAPDFAVFTEELREIVYLEEPVPDDGTISGRGDGFSQHGAFRFTEPVPEPASLILVSTGLAGLLYRSRRKRRRD